MKIVSQSVELIDLTHEPLQSIERAARTCYRSEWKTSEDTAPALVASLIERGHDAMLEFASATFRIVCDRGISHEAVRHRIASYAQESTRWCNYSQDKHGGEIKVIEPPGLTDEVIGVKGAYPGGVVRMLQTSTRDEWIKVCQRAETAYLVLIGSGLSAQIARSVLPTCLATTITMGANLREWRHFLRLRLAPAAHPQMRQIAALIARELAKHVPVVFDEFLPAALEISGKETPECAP